MSRTRAWRYAPVAAALLAACHQPASKAVQTTDAVAEAAASNNEFAWKVLARVGAPRTNVLFSPASATIALGILALGARGETRAEIGRVLAPRPSNAPTSLGALTGIFDEHDGADGSTLRFANRIWYAKNYRVDDQFSSSAEGRFGASRGEVALNDGGDGARIVINQWVLDQTGGQVRDLLAPGVLRGSPQLVLTTAAYFMGFWQHGFSKGTTEIVSFATPWAAKPVAMMSERAELRWGRFGGVQVVDLPYRGAFSMILVLPDAIDGLDEVEKRLEQEFSQWLTRMRSLTMDLFLPRWHERSSLDLRDSLRALGVRRAFEDTADFSGINEAGAKVGFLGQGASIEVNEEGVVAAAATGGEATIKSRPPVVRADHPFVYAIIDRTTGAILFLGRVVDPASTL